ncbi:reverse transcriptase domain-containing protein [Tanacetum coccineum]
MNAYRADLSCKHQPNPLNYLEAELKSSQALTKTRMVLNLPTDNDFYSQPRIVEDVFVKAGNDLLPADFVKEGIVLGHKISKSGIEVDKAKVDVIAKLPHPTTERSNEMNATKLYPRFAKSLTFGAWFSCGPFPVFKREHINPSHRSPSKWVEAKALPTNDARVVCKFLKSLFSKFGAPRAIISDRGTYFCNDQFTKVMLKYGVTHRLSTAYHPQISGQVKVSNRGLKRILERTVGENRASWSDKLDDALWAFRTAYKTPIGCTPYNLKVNSSELNELRDHANENSLIYKRQKTKESMTPDQNPLFNVSDYESPSLTPRLQIFSASVNL